MALSLLPAVLADAEIDWSRHDGILGEWFRMYVEMKFNSDEETNANLIENRQSPVQEICAPNIRGLKNYLITQAYKMEEIWAGSGGNGFDVPPRYEGICVAKIETDTGKMDYDQFVKLRDDVQMFLEQKILLSVEVSWVDDAFE